VAQHTDQAVAFEPHEQTAARLRDNVSLNGIDVGVHECAVADYSGTASPSLPQRTSHELGTGEFSLVPLDDADDAGDVDVVVGDTFVEKRDLPRPTVAKIDVEGAELQALSGLSGTLNSCRELFIEVHRDHVTVGEVTSMLI
jgi:FkbM family methyltransferase